MAAGACPACQYAAVDDVLDRRVGAELEECFDRRGLAGLGGEMEGRHALAVVGAAEGPESVHVGAKLRRDDGSLPCGRLLPPR